MMSNPCGSRAKAGWALCFLRSSMVFSSAQLLCLVTQDLMLVHLPYNTKCRGRSDSGLLDRLGSAAEKPSGASQWDKSRQLMLETGHPRPLSYEQHLKGWDHFGKGINTASMVFGDFISGIDAFTHMVSPSVFLRLLDAYVLARIAVVLSK